MKGLEGLDCRLPGFKPSKPFRRPFQGNNSYSYMPLPSVFQGVQDCRLPGFKPSKPFKPFRRPFQGNNSYSYMPFPRQQLLQLHPFARLQTLQTPQQASKATTLTATCPCHMFFRGFKTAVCPASNPPNPSNPSAGLSKATTLTATCPSQGNNSYSYIRLPGFKPSKYV